MTFRPRNSLSESFFPSWLVIVKSGAGWPGTSIAIPPPLTTPRLRVLEAAGQGWISATLFSPRGASGSEPTDPVLRHAVADHVPGHAEQARCLDLIPAGRVERVLDQHALDALVRLAREHTEKLTERLAERRGRIGACERAVAA